MGMMLDLPTSAEAAILRERAYNATLAQRIDVTTGLTTREPQNLDPAAPGYVGKQHVQDLVTSSRLERELGYELRPDRAHVFLCGNPAMLGIPQKTPDGQIVFPEPPGMIEVFADRGFQFERESWPNIHFESYW